MRALERLINHEGREVGNALQDADPRAPTACTGWVVRDVVAHLAAGAQEIADLIEEHLAGGPARATRSFAEREAPWRALPDDELWAGWRDQSLRKVDAVVRLADRGDDAAIAFTGRPFTATELVTHARSEAALHRWDVIGDDDVSADLLSQPDLTDHAVAVLDTLRVLAEAPARRAAQAQLSSPLAIELHSPGRAPVSLTIGPDTRLLTGPGPTPPDAVVHGDPAARLLALWGRRSSRHPCTVEARDENGQSGDHGHPLAEPERSAQLGDGGGERGGRRLERGDVGDPALVAEAADLVGDADRRADEDEGAVHDELDRVVVRRDDRLQRRPPSLGRGRCAPAPGPAGGTASATTDTRSARPDQVKWLRSVWTWPVPDRKPTRLTMSASRAASRSTRSPLPPTMNGMCACAVASRVAAPSSR